MNNDENILNCALKLFAARGYDSVGIQEVVDVAGVTKPTLYHYFDNKKGLLESILDLNFKNLFIELSKNAIYDGDILNTLLRTVRAYFNFAESNKDFYRLHLSLWFAPPQSESCRLVNPHLAKEYKMIEKIFLDAVTDHGNMKNRHREYAISFQGTVNTYIGLYLNGYSSLDENVIRALVKQFMHGLFS